ncbi:NB-ARC domain-containing protein [Actinoplanes nipponensis]|nr:NB-ARC domain-containing protein [Actinoplanes nipponensis]
MMRHRVVPLLVVASGLVAVVPAALGPYPGLAWPLVALLAVAGIALGWWQRRPAGPAPAVAPQRRPAELPAAPVLVGRAAELAAVSAAVAGGAQLVVLAAAAGTGTSALALRAAHDARDHYPDGQLFAALRGASADPVPPEAVLVRFLRALGRPDDELRGDVAELASRFRSVVDDRRVLVLLDDARDAAQVRHLLPGGAHSLALVTSRRLLSDLLGASVLTIGALPEEAALELLTATAGPGPVAADPDGARRLVRACGGLPLAVRIIGARLRMRAQWSASALADRLDDENRRPAGMRLADRAVRSTLRVVYDELGPGEQLVFRRVGGYPGPSVGLAAAAARCALEEHAVAGALERLAGALLVESPAPDRYRMHDLLRLCARDLAAEGAEDVEGLRRHLRWLTARARPGGWLAAERENVLAAVHAAVGAGLAADARAVIVAVHPLVTGEAEHGYRLRLWQAAIPVATALGDEPFRIRALRWVSHAYGMTGQSRLELPAAQQALAAAERLGTDVREIALAAWRVGDALRALDRFDEAQEALLRALELLTGLGAVADEIEVRLSLGTLDNTFLRPELSTPVLTRAVELLAERDEPERGWALLGLAVAAGLSGQVQRARELVADALGVAERLGDDQLRGHCLQERGWLHVRHGAYRHAERDFAAMLAIFQRLRGGPGVAAAQAALGEIADLRGETAVALSRFELAMAEYERLGLPVRLGQMLQRRAEVLRGLGREQEAEADAARARELIGDAPAHRGPALRRRPDRPRRET